MSSSDITDLIRNMGNGNADAKEQLYNLIYPKLRQIAASIMSRERPGHTLQPTALVHEAVAKMLPRDEFFQTISNRATFFALAATAMRHVLIDHARSKNTLKRNGRQRMQTMPLDQIVLYIRDTEQIDLIALDDALERLRSLCQRQHDIVVYRFFGGLSCQDIATQIGLSRSTVEKDWQFARTWLRKELRS